MRESVWPDALGRKRIDTVTPAAPVASAAAVPDWCWNGDPPRAGAEGRLIPWRGGRQKQPH